MKKISFFLFMLCSAANAAPKIIISDNCLSNIEKAIDETKGEDENDCIKGANVDEVLKKTGYTLEVSYSRNVCEGYENGTAELKLSDVEQIITSSKIILKNCKVKNVTILEESGD